MFSTKEISMIIIDFKQRGKKGSTFVFIDNFFCNLDCELTTTQLAVKQGSS